MREQSCGKGGGGVGGHPWEAVIYKSQRQRRTRAPVEPLGDDATNMFIVLSRPIGGEKRR